MAPPIPSSTCSLHVNGEYTSSRLTLEPSDSDVEDQQPRPNSNKLMETAFIEFSIKDNNDDESNTSQRYQQQKQQRKTWAPSSLSLKPFRAKTLGRNSVPAVSTRKTKTISNSTFSGLLSTFVSVTASSSRLNSTIKETSNDSSLGVSYRLSPFSFETTIPIKSHSASTYSSTSSLSCTPSTRSLPPLSNVNESAPATSKHKVGQLLFGTPILDDPAFFEKEFHAIINDHQLCHHPLSIINPKQSIYRHFYHDEEQRHDNGFLLLKTMNLQQLYLDCQHIGQSTTQWMKDQEDDDQVYQLTMEWGYTNCHRILEQYNRLLAPEMHIKSNDDKKALYLMIRQQLDTMEEDISDEHTLTGLTTLVHSLTHLIYQGILLTNYGRMVIPNKNYWIEGNNLCGDNTLPPSETISASYDTIDHRDEKAVWYSDIFVSQPYYTFAGYKDNQPVILTTLWDGLTNKYMCIYRSTLGPDLRLSLDSSKLNDEGYQEENTCSTMTSEWESALEDAFDLDLSHLVQIESDFIVSSGIEQDLIRLDKDMNHQQFKCGVIYIKDGQYKEDDWFSNDHGSTSFDSFLDCLGEKITLRGYQGWAAGLDTKSGDSGDYTYTSTWQHTYQVTYHISTLIPSTSGDKQHIQKKRHIGNDIVCIVFVDGNRPFDPAAIKSQFLHVFIVVHQEEWHGCICWRVEVTCVKDVPLFGPAVTNQIFYDKTSLSNFLLAKLINAEYAALKAPRFTKPLDRARQGILSNVVERILKVHNKSCGGKVHNNSISSNSNISNNKYHMIAPLRPSTPTTKLKDLLSSDGFVGNLGRRKSAQDTILVISGTKGSSDYQGRQTKTMESTHISETHSTSSHVTTNNQPITTD